MNQARNRRKEAGFSLLEVVVGMLVLTIGLLAVAAMQTYYIRQTIMAQERFAATTLSSQVMEIIMENPARITPIPRRGIKSCTGEGWIQDVCSTLREALLSDDVGTRLEDAEVEVQSIGDVWLVHIYWRVGETERYVATSIRL